MCSVRVLYRRRYARGSLGELIVKLYGTYRTREAQRMLERALDALDNNYVELAKKYMDAASILEWIHMEATE